MKTKKTIPIEVYLPIYKKIKVNDKHLEFKRIYRINYIDSLFSSEKISKLMYDRLVEYANRILPFSSVIEYNDFNFNQMKLYYNGLKSFIESREMIYLSNDKKKQIINELSIVEKIVN